tara:strand:+ start:2708 stop:3715 length:1008 start_codon:yes stop_codon:yes gene_type:complete
MNDINKCLIKKNKLVKPIWFMRQAGRYLPEFRKIRSKNKNFIKLCLNSELSSEITLQPINRYDLDAAIIFSDILLVPFALGQKVTFSKNLGPVLDKFNINNFNSSKFDSFTKKLFQIYRSIKTTRKKLKKDKSLISFVGAPWTLIIYMMNFRKNKIEKDIDRFEKTHQLDEIISKLTDYLCKHIENQVNAGADVVQIFDSWAGLIPKNKLNRLCYLPNKKIVSFCKRIGVPSICFPKGIKSKYKEFVEIVKPNGINIDTEIKTDWAIKNLKNVCIQGGMDPKILLDDRDIVLNEVDKYIESFKNKPYIFNLGHGILPQTNPDVIQVIIDRVRSKL